MSFKQWLAEYEGAVHLGSADTYVNRAGTPSKYKGPNKGEPEEKVHLANYGFQMHKMKKMRNK